ncbi:MAG TPA: 2Fe-2S iron-sulfur cluster-binding protein, partial [Rhodospirillales bacterium]
AFGRHVRRLADKHTNIGVHVAYLEPRPEDKPGRDYDSSGIITIDLLRRLLPGPACDFYLCGPPPFMKALYNALLDWGADEDRIYYEFFGPATVLKEDQATAKKAPTPVAAAKTAADASPGVTVTFQRSGLTVPWDPKAGTILDLAEANGLTPAFSCRSGVCHTCMCGLIEGEVEYVDDDVFLPDDPEQVLICSSRPKTDVTVDV